MDKNCATKEEEFDLVKKTRGEETGRLAGSLQGLQQCSDQVKTHPYFPRNNFV